jgi:hypothetical protein
MIFEPLDIERDTPTSSPSCGNGIPVSIRMDGGKGSVPMMIDHEIEKV